MFIFYYFLPLFPANSPKSQQFKKIKKKPGDIITLHECTKSCVHMMHGSWDMVRNGQTVRRTDERMDRRTVRQTDGKKKWHIELGARPKRISWSDLKFDSDEEMTLYGICEGWLNTEQLCFRRYKETNVRLSWWQAFWKLDIINAVLW